MTSTKLRTDRKYGMPTHFGPCCGPRQTPEGGRFITRGATEVTRFTVNYLTNTAQVERILPPGLTLNGDPVVAVEFAYLKNIAWLAGRGYNTLGVRIPVIYKGETETVEGSFLAVLWENLADPIIVGREQLGYPKIYAEMPEVIMDGNKMRCSASWLGFKFADLEFTPEVTLPPEQVMKLMKGRPVGDGLIMSKYMPRTGGDWNEADASYFTMTPFPARAHIELPADTPAPVMTMGEGSFKFHPAEWEDMPTQYHIVNGLAGMEVLENRGASMMKLYTNDDLLDQRILV